MPTQDGFNTRLDLTLPKSGPPAGAWALYFGSVSPVEPVGDSVFDLTHINGDNYKLTPKSRRHPQARRDLFAHLGRPCAFRIPGHAQCLYRGG